MTFRESVRNRAAFYTRLSGHERVGVLGKSLDVNA